MDVTFKIIGLYAGLILGGAPMLSASWVWLKRQILGTGGLSLMSVGAVVVSLSLAAIAEWKYFKFNAPDGSQVEVQAAKIEALENQLAAVESTTAGTLAAAAETDIRVAALEGSLRGQISDLEKRVHTASVKNQMLTEQIATLSARYVAQQTESWPGDFQWLDQYGVTGVPGKEGTTYTVPGFPGLQWKDVPTGDTVTDPLMKPE